MRSSRRLPAVLSIVVLAASCVVGDPEPGFEAPDDPVISLAAAAPLVNGVPVGGLAGARGQELHYALEVPAGATNLRFTIAGGTGDADLYVRFGQAPTRTAWDYRPYRNGNDETVVPSPIRAGTYYLMLRGYTAFAGVTLTASFTEPTTPPPPPPADDGPDCTAPPTWPAAWVAFEEEVLALLNARRAAGATCGTAVKPPVGPLTADAALREASRCHSLDMAVHGYFSHTSLDGRSPWDRIADAGYTASPTGENIAAGYATPAAVVDGWMASPGHCNNIMNPNSNESGVGYAFRAGSPYGRYWTHTFGRR
jgi:uncharacterized protein YkwD